MPGSPAGGGVIQHAERQIGPRIAGSILGVSVLLTAGCGSLFIRAPEENETLKSASIMLQVQKSNEVFCHYEDGSFQASLDKGQPSERDITSAFSRPPNSNLWSAFNYTLSEGAYTLSASATFTGSLCGSGRRRSDSHPFEVRDPRVELVSVSTSGGFGNGFSAAPAISLDGNYVVFMSRATNLVQGQSLNPNFHQCYVRDLRNQTTEIVSVSSSGVVADNDCVDPTISADGRYVAFASDSTVLDPSVPGTIPVNTSVVYLRDRVAGTTRAISLPETIHGVENVEPALVPDGRAIYYYNFRTYTTAGDPDFGRRIYRFQRSAETTETFKAGGASAVDGRHPAPARIDGWIAFETKEAHPFTHRDGSGFPVTPDATTTKVYLFHYPTGNRYLASNRYWHCYVNGCNYNRWWQNPNAENVNPSISPSGTLVAYESAASNLIAATTVPGSGDRNAARDIYLFTVNRWLIDSEAELVGIPYTRRVSVSSDGAEGDGDSRSPSMGAQHVAFWSLATNLVGDDGNGKADVFRHDTVAGQTIRISKGLTFDTGSFGSIAPSISEDGSRIGFAASGSHSFDAQGFGHTANGQIYVWLE